jgi:class 3 adenylate cyclase
MDHKIGFCTSPDGISIAYGVAGQGPPLVVAPGWVSHLEYTFQEPHAAWVRRMAEHHTFITYDKHGTGLSDRDRTEFTIDAERRDLEAVVDHLGLEQFDLMGGSEGGPAAISYASLHPDRVRRLVLYATFADGPALAPPDFREAFVAVIRSSWGIGSKMLTDMLLPGADPQVAADFARMQRHSTSPSIAGNIIEMIYRTDVTGLLPSVKAPTLVIQRRGDRAFSVKHARILAAGIPEARLTLVEGDQHMTSRGDMDTLANEILGFLDAGRESPAAPVQAQVASMRSILFTDLEGHTEMMQRLGDARGREVLREHERITREALMANGGSEVKTMGDGFLASFGSAQNAIRCAIALERAFAEHEGEPIRVRIGINAGEPIEEEDDLFGSSVILAARIAAKAEGGQVLVADVVRQLVSGKGFLFSDTGEHVLKGMEDPVRIWDLRWQDPDRTS